MEIEEVIRGRRSIRKYKGKDVPDSVIQELLDFARYAPSSMNGQPWYFIVVRSKKTKEELAKIKNEYCPIEKKMYRADFLRDAPVIIVVCVDREKSYDREVENGVLATANILLGAYSRGLGSVYMSAYKTDEPEVSGKIREVLAIPEHITPISLLPLGYPDETPEPKSVRSEEATVFYETYCK
jgi:nitroreductase